MVRPFHDNGHKCVYQFQHVMCNGIRYNLPSVVQSYCIILYDGIVSGFRWLTLCCYNPKNTHVIITAYFAITLFSAQSGIEFWLMNNAFFATGNTRYNMITFLRKTANFHISAPHNHYPPAILLYILYILYIYIYINHGLLKLHFTQ